MGGSALILTPRALPRTLVGQLSLSYMCFLINNPIATCTRPTITSALLASSPIQVWKPYSAYGYKHMHCENTILNVLFYFWPNANFGTNRKPVCDFLCIYVLSCTVSDMVDYWSNFRLWQGVPFVDALVGVEPLHLGWGNLASGN